jgi:hypothetical protein
MPKPSKRFLGLTKALADTFEQIAVGNDAGHPPAMIQALLKKKLIEEVEEKVAGALRPGGPGFVVRKRYYVPTPIHIDWCAWCSTQSKPEEPEE